MKIIITAFVLFFGQINSFSTAYNKASEISAQNSGQSFYYDSLSGIFHYVPQTIAGIDTLLSISYESSRQDPQKAAYAAFQALNMAENMDYDQGVADAHKSLGELYDMFIDYTHALEHYNLALEVERQIGDKDDMGRVLNNIGMIHLKNKEYGKARECFEQVVELISETGTLIKAEALSNLGLISYHLDDHVTSLKYYQNALQLIEGDVVLENFSMNTIANIGNVYSAMNVFNRSEEYLNRAILHFEETGDTRGQIQCHIYQVNLYRKWGKHEEALVHAQHAMKLAESMNDLTYIKEGYRLLSGIYEDQNNTPLALLNYKHFHELHNQLLNSEREARLNQRKIQFEVAHKNREIAQLTSQSANQVLVGKITLTGLGFSIIIGILLYRNIRVKRSANLRLQQKRLEIERQNKQLVQLNQEKNEFLEMAAHDLRNPLSAIKGVVGLMDDKVENDAESRELVNLIKISTNRMLSLIDSFLNVNVDEQAFGSIKLMSFDVSNVIRRVTDNFCQKAKGKKIHLNVDLPPVSTSILADVSRFERIMENLISNAIKFSSSGSTVEIFTRRKGDYLKVMVKDNGPGITQEDHERMFKKFTRLSNKPTGNETSTGLGLYIVKKFAESMGGDISCESKPGSGSTFTISLPLEHNYVNSTLKQKVMHEETQ